MLIRIAIKQSKTDPVQEGHKYLPGKDIIGPLPSIRHPQLPSGKGVTKRPFISAERWEVSYQEVSGHGNSWRTSKCGIEQDKYCGHSPRIGAAITAAANGLEDSVIKTLGRWRSLAYLDYVRIPKDQLAHYSRLLCQ